MTRRRRRRLRRYPLRLGRHRLRQGSRCIGESGTSPAVVVADARPAVTARPIVLVSRALVPALAEDGAGGSSTDQETQHALTRTAAARAAKPTGSRRGRLTALTCHDPQHQQPHNPHNPHKHLLKASSLTRCRFPYSQHSARCSPRNLACVHHCTAHRSTSPAASTSLAAIPFRTKRPVAGVYSAA